MKLKTKNENFLFNKGYMEKFLVENNLPNLENLGPTFKSENVYTIQDLESIIDAQELQKALGDYKNKPGIYVYEWNREILYIGKAKSFKNRIISHFKEGKGLHKDTPIFWPLFFKHYFAKKGLRLHLLEVQGPEDRTILELFYQTLSPAKFEVVKEMFGRKNPRGHIDDLSEEMLKEFEAKFLNLVSSFNEKKIR
jgi:hypothetical protein